MVVPDVVHRTGVGVSLDARPTDALQARGAATLTDAAMIGVGVGSYVIGAFRAAVGIRDLY